MAGKTNPADVLSRLPLEKQPFQERKIVEEYINYVTINEVPKTLTPEEFASVTKADPILQQVQCCLNGAVARRTGSQTLQVGQRCVQGMESFCEVLGLLCRVFFGRQAFLMHMKGTKELCGPNRWSEKKCGGQALCIKWRQWSRPVFLAGLLQTSLTLNHSDRQ